jgi:5-methylthioadenosine/S-adenosylhomocysteine deaminase
MPEPTSPLYTSETPERDADRSAPDGTSRREFIKTSAAGLVAAAVAPAGTLAGPAPAADDGARTVVRNADPPRKLLKGGIVLSLDPRVGDFEKADVLIEGKKIVAIMPTGGRARRQRDDDDDHDDDGREAAGQTIDCSGTIVMPGFVTTHHHQYETIQRSIIPDGILAGVWPQESYGSVVQNIWTAGRITGPGGTVVWDLGRSPYDPEDCYVSELVACLSEITEGITCGTDTSQSSHTPDHTDAMIQGLIDSGRRSVYDYSPGTNRSAQFPDQPYEFPGAKDTTTSGIGRIAKTYFNSPDQLVTLAFAGGPGPAFPDAPYSGWQLGRSFGAWINNHSQASQALFAVPANRAQLLDPNIGPYVTLVHCTRWQDEPLRQVNANTRATTWQLIAEAGAHCSIANIIEMQMRHGMPPFQLALNHGVLPSLSPDVDTNMTTDPFSLMRGAFCLQRALANDLGHAISNPDGLAVPQLVTARQVIEMATIAGAAGSGLLHKVGTLTPGKEADIVVLDARNINVWPMNNVPGTIVTMMNPRHVRDVFIAGKGVYRNGKLVGWNLEKLLRDLEHSRDRVLARIRGRPLVGSLPAGNNSDNPYRPNFLGSCCYVGQNTAAPHYVLRP